MPSLPPSSWMTTRRRASRSGRAARAVRARKPGTVGARARRVEDFRKSRRDSMGLLQKGSRKGAKAQRKGAMDGAFLCALAPLREIPLTNLRLRHRQDQARDASGGIALVLDGRVHGPVDPLTPRRRRL